MTRKREKPSGSAIFMYCVIAVTAFLAMLFDAQFIVIQCYNRPRIVRLIERRKTGAKKV